MVVGYHHLGNHHIVQSLTIWRKQNCHKSKVNSKEKKHPRFSIGERCLFPPFNPKMAPAKLLPPIKTKKKLKWRRPALSFKGFFLPRRYLLPPPWLPPICTTKKRRRRLQPLRWISYTALENLGLVRGFWMKMKIKTSAIEWLSLDWKVPPNWTNTSILW